MQLEVYNFSLPPRKIYKLFESESAFRERIYDFNTYDLESKLSLGSPYAGSKCIYNFVRLGLIDIKFKDKKDQDISDLSELFKDGILAGNNTDMRDFFLNNIQKAQKVVKYTVTLIEPIPGRRNEKEISSSLPELLKPFTPMVVVKKRQAGNWIGIVGDIVGDNKYPFTAVRFSEAGPDKLYEYTINTGETRIVSDDDGSKLIINSIQDQIINNKIYYVCSMTTPAVIISLGSRLRLGSFNFKQLDGTMGEINYRLGEKFPNGESYNDAKFLAHQPYTDNIRSKYYWKSVKESLIFPNEWTDTMKKSIDTGITDGSSLVKDIIFALERGLIQKFIDMDKFKQYGDHGDKLIIKSAQPVLQSATEPLNATQHQTREVPRPPVQNFDNPTDGFGRWGATTTIGGKLKRTHIKRKTMKPRKYNRKKTKRSHKRSTRYYQRQRM
jgi:hypothetical protein